MTNKTKLIDLIKSGNLNLAIELSKGVELDIIELFVKAMDSAEKEKNGVRQMGNYKIRYPGCNNYTDDYWFCFDEAPAEYNNMTCSYTFTSFETPELLAGAILELHKHSNYD